MVTKDKHYYYKGTEYVVVGFTKMKSTLNGEWVEAVQYKRATEVDDPNVEPFTRDQKDFEYKFIPAVLEVGMEIVSESMGRLTGELVVKELYGGGTEAGCAPKGSEEVTLTVSVNVQPTGQLTVVDGGAQATFYFILLENMKQRLANKKVINQIVTSLSNGTQRVANIDPSVDTYGLQEALNSVDQTLENIYRKFGV